MTESHGYKTRQKRKKKNKVTAWITQQGLNHRYILIEICTTAYQRLF